MDNNNIIKYPFFFYLLKTYSNKNYNLYVKEQKISCEKKYNSIKKIIIRIYKPIYIEGNNIKIENLFYEYPIYIMFLDIDDDNNEIRKEISILYKNNIKLINTKTYMDIIFNININLNKFEYNNLSINIPEFQINTKTIFIKDDLLKNQYNIKTYLIII